MDKLIEVNYVDEMKESYLSYALSVINSRAIPDVRDGLKPVHRRILYAMDNLNIYYNKPFKKSARIVGDVLGKYHPHGDTSIYDAMVRMAQDFKTNHILVEGHGNFGSVDGDSAAAMRYTEARLSKLSNHLLRGVNDGLVNFRDNYDQSTTEPEVLPARYCNLLVNGSEGVAVGLATSIPPHNLNEVNNACKAYLENPNISNRGIMRYIKGPDFPTGGEIINGDEIKDIYEKGKGRVKIRAVIDKERLSNGRHALIIKEIPYTQASRKSDLIDDIINLVSARKLSEINDVRDESDMEGIRIVLETKKGVDLDLLKDKLFHMTKLEDTMAFNLLAINNGKPVEFSIRGVIKEYCEFLKDLYIKETKQQLAVQVNKEDKLLGMLKAVSNIDLIIEIIKLSSSKEDVVKCLVYGETDHLDFSTKKSKNEASKLSFTLGQAEEVLKIQLQRLMRLEVKQLKADLETTQVAIKRLRGILSDESKLISIIVNDLNKIKKEHGIYRKTKIGTVESNKYIDKKDNIVEELYVLIDRFNYIKCIDKNSYSRTSEETLQAYKHVIKAMSNDSIFVLDRNNKVHQYKLQDMPISKITERGEPMPSGVDIMKVLPGNEFMDRLIVFVTKKGYVKLVKSKNLISTRREVVLTKLEKDDEIIYVDILSKEHKEIEIVSQYRRLRFNIDEIPIQGKNARGVIGIRLDPGDIVEKVSISSQTQNLKFKRAAKGELIE